MMRIGQGYDVHQLVSGRPLIVGGIQIPHDRGLLGHSDADVLTHAICDAMLGALALSDIGTHFPDTDPQWQGADSIKLLEAVKAMVTQRGYQIANIDSTLIAEKPKFKPHIKAITARLSEALGIGPEHISVKATTNEKMGWLGREEGIAAMAVVLLVSGVAS